MLARFAKRFFQKNDICLQSFSYPHLLWMTESTNNTAKPGAKRFGIDHSTGHIIMGPTRIPCRNRARPAF
jgi:hypothetical protein